jgi:hypothetical protein
MFIEIIFFISFMSVSIKLKMNYSDEITSGVKKSGFNFTNNNCSNCYFNFHFNKSFLCRICISFIHGLKQLKKVDDVITVLT